MSATKSTEEGWAELRQWGRERELGELDALMWRTERHPANSWTGIVVLLLDSAPDWDRLWAAHEWFVSIVPRFRERVIDPALPVGPAVWAADEAFDLGYHLRHVRLAEPGTKRQLLDYAQSLALTPMDRTRPPWQGTLVDGLEGGRSAYLMQAQHVLMDGMGLTQLFSRVLSTHRETTPDKPGGTAELPAVGSVEVAGDSLARQAQATPRLLGRVLGTARSAVRHPADATRYVSSLGKVLAPPPPNRSKVLQGGSRRMWRFGMIECGLPELKAAGKAAGGTVNDTFVSVLLGGLRRYCAEFGEDLPDIPISMPVAMRKFDEAMKGGNKFAGAFFAVPSSIADPAERIAEMHRRVEKVRSEPALDFLGNITPFLNRTPSGLAAALLGGINARAVLTTSSWPGLMEPRFVAGARFERMFVFAPLPGTSLTGAMCTHAGICCIGINVDGEVFTEPDLLWEAMEHSLDEILALAPNPAASNGHSDSPPPKLKS